MGKLLWAANAMMAKGISRGVHLIKFSIPAVKSSESTDWTEIS